MPRSFGPYELRELLGRGGMGEVYRAFHQAQAREVALKLPSAGLADDPGFVERFAAFARAAARVIGPRTAGAPFYAPVN